MRERGGFTLAEVIVSLLLTVLLWGGALAALTAAARMTARWQELRRLELLADILLDEVEDSLSGCRPAGAGTVEDSVGLTPAGDAASFRDAAGEAVTVCLADGRLVFRREAGAESASDAVYQGMRATALAFSPVESPAQRPGLVRVSLELTAPGGTAYREERLIVCFDLRGGLP